MSWKRPPVEEAPKSAQRSKRRRDNGEAVVSESVTFFGNLAARSSALRRFQRQDPQMKPFQGFLGVFSENAAD